MAKPYDSTSKFLVDEFPRDWLALAGLPTDDPVELVDTNLSTITAEADRVIRVAAESPWLAHIELQTSRDPRLACRLFRYNALLDERHDLPIRSVAILLRRDAEGPDLTGEYRRGLPGGPEYLSFRYGVVRVWREPVESFLTGGLGILPLAPLADLGAMPLEGVVRAMEQRIDRAPPAECGLLWSSTAVLMGLSYPADLIQHLLRGARQMEESSFYQMILAKGEAKGLARGKAEGLARGKAEGLARGRVREARATLIRLAEHRFGPIAPADRASINKVVDLDRLRDWTNLVLDASTWAEFWALAGGAGAD